MLIPPACVRARVPFFAVPAEARVASEAWKKNKKISCGTESSPTSCLASFPSSFQGNCCLSLASQNLLTNTRWGPPAGSREVLGRFSSSSVFIYLFIHLFKKSIRQKSGRALISTHAMLGICHFGRNRTVQSHANSHLTNTSKGYVCVGASLRHTVEVYI